MAYKIVRIEKDKKQSGTEISAVLDSVDDLASLGTNYAPGSMAVIADSGAPTYMLNASGEWKRI